MKKVLFLLLVTISLASCLVSVAPDVRVGKALITNKNGITIGEMSALYKISGTSVYVLVNEDGTLYDGK